jgi:hypothetical protein
MKKMMTTLAFATTTVIASAQFQVNPQIGLNFQKVTDAKPGSDFKAALGWTLGADARIGDRLFLQPGVFIGRNATTMSFGEGTTVAVKDDLIRTTLKLRAMAGYRIIDTYQFDMRFMLGPSYDVLMSVDSKDNNIDWNRGDFNAGSFNIEAGFGFDMGLFTLAPTASFGLSKVFKDNPNISNVDSKYMTYGLTIGMNFGDDDAQ